MEPASREDSTGLEFPLDEGEHTDVGGDDEDVEGQIPKG